MAGYGKSGNTLLTDSLISERSLDGSTQKFHRLIHRIGLEVRPGYIAATNNFFQGAETGKPINNSQSEHLKYSFVYHPDTYRGRIYGGVYQGLGIAHYTFHERALLGNPTAIYLLQGARIARIGELVSLNYEWNFGLSVGWHPYDPTANPNNKVTGSRINAYINTDFYLNWPLSARLDLTTGISLTHFSNGNTQVPNTGLNAVGLGVGLVYNFNRERSLAQRLRSRKAFSQASIPDFPRHVSYDLVLFGSWRRKGVPYGETLVASPEAYPVFGFNFTPMYNFSYKFRAGLSLDGFYDGSANVHIDSDASPSGENGELPLITPPLREQVALGLSGRVEYTMPYFTVGIGIGVNVLHRGGDLKSVYQVLALKIAMSRSTFVHIGYSLRNFQDPNFLMLGFGFRFNNHYPIFR